MDQRLCEKVKERAENSIVRNKTVYFEIRYEDFNRLRAVMDSLGLGQSALLRGIVMTYLDELIPSPSDQEVSE